MTISTVEQSNMDPNEPKEHADADNVPEDEHTAPLLGDPLLAITDSTIRECYMFPDKPCEEPNNCGRGYGVCRWMP